MNVQAAADPERYRTRRRRIVAGIIDLLVLQLLWSANDWVHRPHPAVVKLLDASEARLPTLWQSLRSAGRHARLDTAPMTG